MAVVQISKIQVRRGLENQTGIPYLSSGEFAWSIDTQNLYIGPGSVAEGSPSAYPPIRVLTTNDFSNFFKFAGSYTYQGNSPSVETLLAGTGTNYAVQRSLQNKLDDYVSLADFGAVGDGVADDTKALQSAIDQLYLNVDKNNPQSRRRLKFPAGTYLVTGTIYIPPFASIEGEGSSSTFVVCHPTIPSSAVLQTVGGNSTPTNKVILPNIAGTTPPQEIKISGLTVQYKTAADQQGGVDVSGYINLDCVANTVLDDVGVIGLAANPINDTTPGIYIRGQNSLTTTNLKIKNCKFENVHTGIFSNYNVNQITINNSKFFNLVHGLRFDTGFQVGVQTIGPQTVKVFQNTFEKTQYQAIYAKSDTQMIADMNLFTNCGNGNSLMTDADQMTEVIYSNGFGNQFINNQFSREVENLLGNPGTYVTAISGTSYLVNYNPIALNLAVSNIPTTIITLAKPETDLQLSISYNATQPSLGVTRVGQLQVLAGANTATIVDNFQWTGASILTGDIQFSATLNTSTNALTVAVTNPVGSVPTNLTYQFTRLY